jgi:hypothetical protein
MEKSMSTAIARIKLNDDWFEPLEYAPENVICEVLEEDEDNGNDIRAYRNFDIDFDESGFSIWADL